MIICCTAFQESNFFHKFHSWWKLKFNFWKENRRKLLWNRRSILKLKIEKRRMFGWVFWWRKFKIKDTKHPQLNPKKSLANLDVFERKNSIFLFLSKIEAEKNRRIKEHLFSFGFSWERWKPTRSICRNLVLSRIIVVYNVMFIDYFCVKIISDQWFFNSCILLAQRNITNSSIFHPT